MLPTEAFAEAVAFLRLFDLNALLVANALCSSLALKASTAIRWEDFSGLGMYITDEWIAIGRPTDDADEYCWLHVTALSFPSEDDTADFIAAALPNCVFEEVVFGDVSDLSEQVMDAMGRVANSVIIKGVLNPPSGMSPDDIITLVRKFRKVKALLLSSARISDDQAHEFAKLYRESRAEELHYYSLNGGSRKKLALI